jgi:thermitase
MGYTRHRTIILAVGLVAGLNTWAGTEFPAGPGEQVVANELIIRLKAGANANALIAGYLPGAQVQSLGRDPLFRIRVPGGIPNGISTRIAADLQVEYVEPNRVRHTMVAAPNDPNYASSWWFQTVQAVQAWSLLPGQYLTAATAGTGRVKVAVLDTGADCTHPDFINTGGSSTDAAQGGQLMFSVSHAYVATTISSPVCTWQDDHGHGTHVTGIVAAATSNAVGVSGLGYPVQVIEFKVLDSTGSGADTVISQAIKDAADAGAQVVSMSLGGAGYSQTLQDAVTYAWQKNTLVVAAAGNSASSSLFFPAGANHAVGVSATDSSNNLASFSNFGNSVQLAAPGVGILSTAPTYSASQGWFNYVSLSGTSMATPFVSALAGLMAMTTPNTTGQAILQRMEQTASSNTAGGGWGQNFGYGIINASSSVAGTLRAAANGAMAGQIVNASSPPAPVSGAQITVNSQTITTDSTGLYRFGTLPAGTYSVTVVATGFTTQSLSATVVPGADTSFTVAMGVAYGKFTGAVTDQGAGVSGAIVQALSGGLITAVAVADLNGQYTLWVPGGTYDVRASAIGRITTTVSALTVSAGGTTSANLNLPRLGTIAGSVRDGNLNPVANAQLLVTGGGFSAGAATDGNGNYSLPGIPSGTQYAVTATATGFPASTQNGITVSADVTSNVNFTMVSSTVATPTFNPPGGSYTSTQNVTISSTTPLASIRYTTDGSTPSETVGTLYNTPVAVSSSLTLRAIAYKAGMTDSAVPSATYTISGGGGGSPWYNSSWTNRKPITVDHTQVSGPSSLSNFPMLFSVIDANLKTVANGGSVGKSDGTDILFTAADAVTKLAHEIERYNPATGELVAWVKVPALSPSADTSLYVYYGNAAAADQQDRVNTWDSNYKIVNHLKEASGPVLDSTSNANNATPSASGATLVSAGKMGGAYSFDGVTGMLTTPSNPSWNGSSSNYTVQLWVKFNATPTDYSAAVSAGGWGGPLSIWFTASGTSIFRMDSAALCQTYGSLTPDTTTFHQLVMTYNGSQLVPYIDGVPANSYPPSCTGTTSFAANSLTLGGFNPGKMLPSTIDEFRISSSSRSADWILTEFRNQNSPAAFYAVGSQQ